MGPGEGEHFDVVVIGSGFGGAVAARRLGEAGLRVALLERGQEWPPGSFPRTPLGLRRALWAPDHGLQGLWDYWSFRGIDALVAAGVGGGSLIYANVLLRKDEETFAEWPIERADLEPGYERAERELGAVPYPVGREPWASTPKTAAFREAAERAGFEPFHPPLAVSFGSRPGEPLEPGRESCRLVGECTAGCNFGAKNTLDLTYLRDAPVEIHPRCDVRTITPRDGDGYRVGYVRRDPAHVDRRIRSDWLFERSVIADRVVVAAGALATSRLLLANRRRLPRLGTALGTRFSGNGDLMSFVRSAPRDLDPSYGPTITTALRGPGGAFYLEDAGLPALLMWLLQAVEAPATLWRYRRFVARYLPLKLGLPVRADMGAAVAEVIGDARRSHATLPLLGMGLDTPDGVLSLRRGHLAVEWRSSGSAAHFRRLRDAAREVAHAMGGRFVDLPLWRLHRVVTVHPLGGAPMGATIRTGVVDAHGEAFGHRGLYVTCGAAMPGPVGPNPSLTIAAWAERVAAGIAERAA
jgi:cholesterol oxidase